MRSEACTEWASCNCSFSNMQIWCVLVFFSDTASPRVYLFKKLICIYMYFPFLLMFRTVCGYFHVGVFIYEYIYICIVLAFNCSWFAHLYLELLIYFWNSRFKIALSFCQILNCVRRCCRMAWERKQIISCEDKVCSMRTVEGQAADKWGRNH